MRLPDDVFEAATVNTVVFTLSAAKDDRAIIANEFSVYNFSGSKRITSLDLKSSQHSVVRQKEWRGNEAMMFIDSGSKGETGLLNKIKKMGMPMSSICDFAVGVQAYDSYVGQSKETIKNRIYNSNKKLNKTYMKELNGNDVSRYHYSWPGDTWISYGEWLAHPRQPKYFQEPRILVREITSADKHAIHATYVDEPFINYKSILNMLLLSEASAAGYSLHALLGVINSSLFSWSFPRSSNKIVTKTFPRISILDLKRFLVVPIDASGKKKIYDKLADSTKLLISLNKKRREESDRGGSAMRLQRQIDATDRQIDALVYELYGLTDEEIKIVEGATS